MKMENERGSQTVIFGVEHFFKNTAVSLAETRGGLRYHFFRRRRRRREIENRSAVAASPA